MLHLCLLSPSSHFVIVAPLASTRKHREGSSPEVKEVPAALEKLNEVPSAPEEDLHTSFLALHVPGEGGGGGVGDGGGDRSDDGGSSGDDDGDIGGDDGGGGGGDGGSGGGGGDGDGG